MNKNTQIFILLTLLLFLLALFSLYWRRFADVDMIAKTQDFYQKYYNYNLSKENAQQILKPQPPQNNKTKKKKPQEKCTNR